MMHIDISHIRIKEESGPEVHLLDAVQLSLSQWGNSTLLMHAVISSQVHRGNGI